MDHYIKASEKPQAGWVSPALIDDRLEAEYYNPAYVALDIVLENSGLPIDTLGNIAKIFTGPFGSNLPSSLYRKSGIPLLRVQNIGDFSIDWDNLVFLDQTTHEHLGDSRLLTDDLALAKSGSFGNIAPIWPIYGECNITEHILGIRVTDPNVDPLFLATFLVSSYGLGQIKRKALGTILKYLGVQVSRGIKIPKVDIKTQAFISNKVRLAEKCREEARKSQEALDNLLMNVIGIPNEIELFPSGYFTVKDINSTLRLNPSFSHPYYENLIGQIPISKLPLKRVAQIKKSRNIAKEFGSKFIQYFELGNCRGDKPLLESTLCQADLAPSRAKIHLTKGDILISKVKESIETTVFVDHCENNWIATNGFVALKSIEPTRIPNGYLYSITKTKWFVALKCRMLTGTNIQSISDDDILDIPIPIASEEVMRLADAYVQRMFYLQRKANDLTTQAKLDVQQLIENHQLTQDLNFGSQLTWDDINKAFKSE